MHRVPIRDAERRPGPAIALVVRATGIGLLLVFAAAAVVVGVGCAPGASVEATATPALPAEYPRLDRALPEFQLLDQHGVPFDDTMLRGEPTILSFVFAHCQTVCPALAKNASGALQRLGHGDARLVLVTLDPWRDSPATLESLAESWGLPPDARLLSGDPERVEALLEAFHVERKRDLQNGEVDHAPLVFVIDGEGRVVYMFNNPSVEWIVEGVHRVNRPS